MQSQPTNTSNKSQTSGWAGDADRRASVTSSGSSNPTTGAHNGDESAVDEDDTRHGIWGANQTEDILQSMNLSQGMKQLGIMTKGQTNTQLLQQLVQLNNDMMLQQNNMMLLMQQMLEVQRYQANEIHALRLSGLSGGGGGGGIGGGGNYSSNITPSGLINMESYSSYSTPKAVCMYILQMLKVAKKEMRSRGIDGFCTRTVNITHLTTLCTFLINKGFQPPISLPQRNDPCVLAVLPKLFSTNKTLELEVAIETLAQIARDPVTMPFMAVVRGTVERLCRVPECIAYLDADLLKLMRHPYFSQEGELLLDWDSFKPRHEDINETRVMDMNAKEREQYIILRAAGKPVVQSIGKIYADRELKKAGRQE